MEQLVRFSDLSAATKTALSNGTYTPFTAEYDCLLYVTGSSGYAMITTTTNSEMEYVLDRCDVPNSSVCAATAYVKKGQTVYCRASGTNRYMTVRKLNSIKEIQIIKY